MKKYFGEEYVFEFIWRHCDPNGLWDGDAGSVAREFGVSEDESHSALDALCDRNLIEQLPGSYAITNWRERDDPGEE